MASTTIKFNPLPHQTEIINLACSNNGRGIIHHFSDRVGSGKTYEALMFIDENIINKTKRTRTDKGMLYYTRFAYGYRFKEKKTNASICLVNNNVIKQWETIIKQNTTMKCYTISTSSQLQAISSVDDYDIILIKNGTCSIKTKKYVILDYFIDKFGDYMFNNIILDDVARNFMISESVVASNVVLLRAKDPRFQFFDGYRLPYETDEKVLNASLSLPKCTQFIYKIPRNDDNIIDLLVNIADESIIDSINADIIPKHFTKKKYKSTFDIFSHLLGESLDKYKEDLKLLDKYEKQLLNADQHEIPNITTNINEVKSRIDINLKPLDRLRDNIKNNTCPISYNNLSESDNIIILGCCSVIIDGSCGLMILSNPQCPHCREKITNDNMICLDIVNLKLSGFDIDKLMSSEDVIVQSSDKIIGSKMLLMNDILMFNFDGKASIESLLRMDILNGSSDYGFADKQDRKILIFSNYDENIVVLESMIKDCGLRFGVLKGTPKQIETTSMRYWADGSDPTALDLLLINSTKYSMGMNLQNTTDIILYHSILDRGYLSQVVGRCVRIGQKKNLRLHLLLYNNEYFSYKQSQKQ